MSRSPINSPEAHTKVAEDNTTGVGKRSALVACTLSATCTNGQLQYSSGGQIVGAATLLSAGNNIDIGQSGVSITPYSPSKLVLRGTSANQPNGPHIQTYAEDDYPIMQLLSYSHDNNGLIFDAFLDSAANWVSSDPSSFRFYKYDNTLKIDYATDTPGDYTVWYDALVVDSNTGTVSMDAISVGTGTYTTGIYLPGGTPSLLNYYQETTATLAVGPASGGGTTVSGTAKFTRIGNVVTMHVYPCMTATLASADGLSLGYTLPADLRPDADVSFVVPVIQGSGVYDTGVAYISTFGWIRVYKGPIYAPGTFTAGSNRGWIHSLSASWTT